MENKRGSGIFLSVIGVATLIVAIIGATFAYFSATAASNNDAISVESTELDLGFTDDTNHLKTNMIPSTFAIAEYAAFDEVWTDTSKKVTVETKWDKDGNPTETAEIDAPGQCIDQNGNEICSVYDFYVGNPSATTNMDVEGMITVTTNDFENLQYAIYDERLYNDDITDLAPIATGVFPDAGDDAEIAAFTQTLEAYAGVAGDGFKEDDPSTYTPSLDMSLATNVGKSTNVRHYTMLIWINETKGDQTEADAGKIFAAGITFKTGGASGGVTGVIAVAKQ